VTQHSTLTPERWARFDLDRQVLMIGNEMNRGARLTEESASGPLLGCYERVLRLTDLTVAVNPRRSLRKELLRWRDLVAELYLAAGHGAGLDAEAHAMAFRALLQLRPVAAKQIPLLMG
jgi:hypothetical protein